MKKVKLSLKGRPFCKEKAIGRGVLFIKAIGMSTLLANTLMFTYTFLVAYLNNYSVMVHINNYHEAHIELILILVTTPIALYTTWKVLHE